MRLGHRTKVAGAVVAALAVVGAGIGVGVAIGHSGGGRSTRQSAHTTPATPTTAAPGPGTTVAAAPVSSCPPSTAANPTFGRVSGNHLLDGAGRVFVPTGMTVYGLAYPTDWQSRVTGDDAQITAAARQWCTNYVRLQIAPSVLLSAQPDDPAYLAAIGQEVSTALALNEDVMLSCQTEHTPGGKPLNPDASVVAFWRILATKYAGNPRVAFDLFNEPRGAVHTTTTNVWSVWHDGGDGYVGMQQLAAGIRAVADNVIIVEGPNGASELKLLPKYPITVANVVYAVHPYRQPNEQTWTSAWGKEAAQYPVIVNEWSTYSRSSKECLPDAATVVPEFLSYLHQRQIGLGVWALIPGVLVTNSTTFAPTQITSSFSCNPPAAVETAIVSSIADGGATPVPAAAGAGQLIQNYFRQQ